MRIVTARNLQTERYKKHKNIRTNSDLNAKALSDLIPLSDKVKETLELAAKKLDLSPRAFHRTIKVARTIADLEGSENIEEEHILEAVSFRKKVD